MNNNPLDLYESISGWEEASKDIISIIKIARMEYVKTNDATEAYREVKAVLHKYSPWVATDSEPEWAASKMFCKGFDLDPSDFA